MLDRNGHLHSGFFWFGDTRLSKQFHDLAPSATIKINATTPAQIDTAIAEYNAGIIEFDLSDDYPTLINHCRTRGIKSMFLEKTNDRGAFAKIIAAQPDMINLDHGDEFLHYLNIREQPQ